MPGAKVWYYCTTLYLLVQLCVGGNFKNEEGGNEGGREREPSSGVSRCKGWYPWNARVLSVSPSSRSRELSFDDRVVARNFRRGVGPPQRDRVCHNAVLFVRIRVVCRRGFVFCGCPLLSAPTAFCLTPETYGTPCTLVDIGHTQSSSGTPCMIQSAAAAAATAHARAVCRLFISTRTLTLVVPSLIRPPPCSLACDCGSR